MEKQRRKYDYGWTQVSVSPETKELLRYLCIVMGNEYVALPMSTVVDALIRQKVAQFEK